MGISPENMGGDCFVQAVENAMADSSLLVCHGIVHGQGALEGIVFPHAWNEDNGIVIDTSNGHDIVMPVDAYYAIGRIDPADVRKYDNGQMMREVVRTGTYGPWDDMFDFDYRVVDDRKASRERTIMGNDMNRVARRALRKRAGFDMDKIVDEVYKAASDWIRSHFGDEEVDYLYVEVTDFDTIEVRDELSYDENYMLIKEALNPIVQSYDPTSFFDFYAATVLRAVVWDEDMRKETWHVKHAVDAVDGGEYDLVWLEDLNLYPYVVKEIDGAWYVGTLGVDGKAYFDNTGIFNSWGDAMKSIPSSDVYEFVRVGSNLRGAHLFNDDEDRMLTVMDDAMKAWSGAGRYSVEPGGYQEWCDYAGDLELLVSRAYAAASENDVVTVRYLGIGTDPHEVEGGRTMPNDNAKRKRAGFDGRMLLNNLYTYAADWIFSHVGYDYDVMDNLHVEATGPDTIEVRDGLSYDENLMLIREVLDPVIQRHDPTAFFDFYTADVLRATFGEDMFEFYAATVGNAERKSVLGANDGLDESVREWAFDVGEGAFFENCPLDVTFRDVWESIQRGDDFDEMTRTGDSVSCEGVLLELARILGLDYGYVYRLWDQGRKERLRTWNPVSGCRVFGAKKTAQSSVATFEDINYFLSEAADACAELEDYYFGEPVVDCLSRAYDHCEAAIDEIVRASILVSE